MSGPAIRYDVLHEYARAHRLDYDDLCSTVRAALPQPADTLRDLFAAAAMQSLLHPGITGEWLMETYGTNSVAYAAYQHADTMLVARGDA